MSEEGFTIGRLNGCEIVCRRGVPHIETTQRFAELVRQMAKALAVDRFSLCRIEIVQDE